MSGRRKALYKIVVLGDSAVGKSSIIKQFVKRRFSETYHATIGADFITEEVSLDGKMMTMQIWDTAGQERFQSLGTAYFRGADCCILVYDLTKAETLKSLEQWKDEFLLQSSPRNAELFPFVIVGNKSDLLKDEVPNDGNSKLWFKDLQVMTHILTSAKDGSNVNSAFLEAAKKAYQWNDIEKVDIELPDMVEIQENNSPFSCSC